MKKITIYLDKKILNQVKIKAKKYHISLSTLANESVKILKVWGNPEKQKENLKEIYLTNIKLETKTKKNDPNYKNQIIKTTLKPRNELKIKIDSWDLTLALEILTNKEIRSKCFETKEKEQTYLTKVNKNCMEIKENYYNYNERVRNFTKFIKQNPDYIKKLLEQAK